MTGSVDTELTTSNRIFDGMSKPESCVELKPKQPATKRISSWSSINSRGSGSSDGANDGRMRLSLIQEILAKAGGKRPSSSVIMDIRSLLSSSSRRSSRISQKSFSTTISANRVSLLPERSGLDPRNKLIIEFCCRHRLDCLHRRVSRLLGNPDPVAIICQLTSQELFLKDDRDMWNSTILHLIAQWAKDMSVVNLLTAITKRCEVSMISACNIEGDTFLHMFARRWTESEETPDAELLKELIHSVSSRGFRFDTWNVLGYNIFASFIPEDLVKPDTSIFPTKPHRKVVRTLRSLFDVEDGGRFLRESLAAPSRAGNDPVSMFLWSKTMYNESIDDEIHIRDSTREKYQDWRLASHTTYHTKLPSLHLYLAHDAAKSADLLDRGANANEYNEEGKTCLMVLLEKSQLPEKDTYALVQTLLDRGARVNLLDWDGNSVLHYAVNSTFPNALQQLLKSGADLDAQNIHGTTCVDMAIKNYNLARYNPARLWRGSTYFLAQVMLVQLVDAKPGSRWMESHSELLPKIQE